MHRTRTGAVCAINDGAFNPELHLQVAHQSPAVLGLALVAMTEDLGSAMALRTLEHLLQYGEPAVRCCLWFDRRIAHPIPHSNKTQFVLDLDKGLDSTAEQRCGEASSHCL